MSRVLSTYRYVRYPLTPAVLEGFAHAEISSVEIFCAPSHFNYRDPQSVREIAGALEHYGIELHALHSPTERDTGTGREMAVSISNPERVRRVDAVDEVKRALEVAERIPFRCLVQHLGSGRDSADPRRLDAAFSSLEHLALFAKQRGVTIALENTPNELGAPATLRQFVRETRLTELRFCFDIGHAHLGGGVEPGFDLLRERVVTTHIHDNRGEKDEHLLPYEGTIDWDAALTALAAAPEPLPLVLELKERPSSGPALDEIRSAFEKLERHFEEKGVRSTPA